MSDAWPRVRLGEVLRRSEESVQIVPDLEYREITVRLWGNGVVERGRVLGAEIAGARRFVARTDQFIASRIDARNGAMGLVPPELDGAVVANDFPVFDVAGDRLLPKFLGWLSRTREFVELCVRASEGTTNRVRLKEDRFLALEIPVPPPAEQRRIVAYIDTLARQTRHTSDLQNQASAERDALLVAMAHRADLSIRAKRDAGWRWLRLGDVIRLARDPQPVFAERQYPNFGIYSFGRGLFGKPPIDGGSTGAATLFRVRARQFVYSRLFAFEGAYGYVTPEFDGYFVSNEYPTFDCSEVEVLPEFLVTYFKPESVWRAVAVGSKGLGHRRQRVQPQHILDYQLWIPPIVRQIELVEAHREIERARSLSACMQQQLGALLPTLLDRAFVGRL